LIYSDLKKQMNTKIHLLELVFLMKKNNGYPFLGNEQCIPLASRAGTSPDPYDKKRLNSA